MKEKDIKKIQRLRREGFSLREIARKTDWSHEHVRQHVMAAYTPKRKMGRPPKHGERMLVFRFYLPPWLVGLLDAYARKKKISRNDALVRVLKFFLCGAGRREKRRR